MSPKDASQYKYLFFNSPKLTQNILSRTVCVKECPTATTTSIDCLTNANVTRCDTLKAYATHVLFERFCIPDEKELLQAVGSVFAGVNAESIIESLIQNRWIILGCLGFAFALSYFFSFFLQYCTWLIVAISIVGIYALGIYLSILSWSRYKSIMREPMTPENQD